MGAVAAPPVTFQILPKLLRFEPRLIAPITKRSP